MLKKLRLMEEIQRKKLQVLKGSGRVSNDMVESRSIKRESKTKRNNFDFGKNKIVVLKLRI